MSRVYVFDLDGTVANVDHRLHFVKPPLVDNSINSAIVRGILAHQSWKPDWKSFFEACIHDEPVAWVVDLMRGLHEGVLLEEDVILILSGRSNAVRKQTEFWLEANMIPYDGLLMRPEGNFHAGEHVKLDMLDAWLIARGLERTAVQFIVDDRQKVVDMWRRQGFNVLQCAAWKEEGRGDQ